MVTNSRLSAGTDLAGRGAMHVLTLTPFYPVAGDDSLGSFVAEPLPWVEKLGVRNTVIAAQPFYRGMARAADLMPVAQWRHFFTLPGGNGLPTSGAFLFSRILSEVRRLHEADPIHVIHAHAALPCGHAAVLLGRELGIPFVVTVHGLDAFSTRQVGGYAGRWCERVSRMVYQSAQWVICVSDKVRDAVLSGAPSAHATVVYNGVDPQMFSPGEHPGESAIVLSVGNLIPIKGHEQLLRSFGALDRSNANLSCEIIGDGPQLSRLEALCDKLNIGDKVVFSGRQSRSRVVEAMRQCTIFVLPSRYEGLGCVYLEAMSVGKPVIACTGQGISEVIEQGVNGWLVEAGNVAELTEALSCLLKDGERRRRLGQAGRRTILQDFTLARQAERLYELYRESAA
jgi:teichuronic acid biosynthesis glycosyltransferase TuaC